MCTISLVCATSEIFKTTKILAASFNASRSHNRTIRKQSRRHGAVGSFAPHSHTKEKSNRGRFTLRVADGEAVGFRRWAHQKQTARSAFQHRLCDRRRDTNEPRAFTPSNVKQRVLFTGSGTFDFEEPQLLFDVGTNTVHFFVIRLNGGRSAISRTSKTNARCQHTANDEKFRQNALH